MIDYAIIGQRIRQKRLFLHLTQEYLANEVSITVPYLSKIENGRVYPTLETLSYLCNALDMDLSQLLSGVEVEPGGYTDEQVLALFNACSPHVKHIAFNVLQELSKLK